MDSIINNFGGIIMINFAHRGASSEYPENTMLAFEEAVRIGADGIELDVHKSSDGKLIVIHDEDVRRTHLGNGLVKDFTLKEIKTFKCRKKIFRDNDKALIPTLNEVLELLKNTSLLLNIELNKINEENQKVKDEKQIIENELEEIRQKQLEEENKRKQKIAYKIMKFIKNEK